MDGVHSNTMVKIIKNNNKSNPQYLSIETVLACFVLGGITHVDKLLCGNGFTTSFLKLIPKRGYVNIILFPNRSAIKSKEKQYRKDPDSFENDMKFFYGGSRDKDFSEANVLCFVIDSFVGRYASIVNNNLKVDKLLIDEFHSTEDQSSFRKNLKNLMSKVKEIIPNDDAAITTVTASPLFTSDVDIQISMENTRALKIAHSKNQNLSIERIVKDYKNGKSLVIGTQSPLLIKTISRELGFPAAIYEVGRTVKNRLVREATIKVHKGNGQARVVFVSSAGFEGFDLTGYNNASMYFFEDRGTNAEHKTQNFNPQKMYQFFNRIRVDKDNKGADYFEYNRQETGAIRKLPLKENAVDKFIKDDSISNEKKMTSDYKKYHPFVVFSDNEHKKEIEKDEITFRLFDEALMWDENFSDYVSRSYRNKQVSNFFKDRKIEFYGIDKGSNCTRASLRPATADMQSKYLYSNIEVIESDYYAEEGECIFGSDHILKTSAEVPAYVETFKLKNYLKDLEIYLREKNYNGEYIITDRQLIALGLLKGSNRFSKLVRKVVKSYNKKSIEKHGVKGSKKWRDEFKEQAEYYVANWCMALANDKVKVYDKWRGHRSYNLATQRSFNVIELIAQEFGMTATSLDIKSAFPRIIHAICGVELPKNFYGENKENKIDINVWLNKITYKGDRGNDKNMATHKSNVRARLKAFNFLPEVLDYLIDEFANSDYKSDLFTRISYEEKKIMDKVIRMLEKMSNDGVVRRHDEVVVFNNMSDLSEFNIEPFVVNGFISIGWFDMEIPITQDQDKYVNDIVNTPVNVFVRVKDSQPELLINSDIEFDEFLSDKIMVDKINRIGYGL